MKTLSCLLLVAAALVGGPVAWADVVKLKDGTTVAGDILSETDTLLVIEKTLAGGTITSRETIAKTDIADVIRDTPAEKARQAMERAYEFTKRFRLDPQASLTKERYDQVLDGTLRKFLTDYPDSPHTAEVAGKVAEWEAERDRVAGGEVKVDGRWLTGEETKEMQTQALIRLARQLMASEQFTEAAQRLEQVAPTAPITSALRECYQRWQQWLVARKKGLETEITAVEQRVAQARQKVGATQAKSPAGSGFSSGKMTDSKLDSKVGSFGEAAAAKSELAALELRLERLQSQLAETQRGLVTVEARAVEVGADVSVAAGKESRTNAPEAGVTAPAATEAPAGEEDVLTALVTWFKNYWLWAVGILVVVIWYVTHRLGQ